MRGIPPYTAVFWTTDSPDQIRRPISKMFTSATEGLDWLLAAANADKHFTGEIEIFDSYGSCLYSDMLCVYNSHEADDVAS